MNTRVFCLAARHRCSAHVWCYIFNYLQAVHLFQLHPEVLQGLVVPVQSHILILFSIIKTTTIKQYSDIDCGT